MTGRQVDQIGRDEKWCNPARTALVQGQRPFGDPGETTDTGANHDTGALALILAVRCPIGILDRLGGRGQRIDDKAVHLALILGRNPVIRVEQPRRGITARHLGRDPRRKIGHVERLDRADARDAGNQVLPISLEANAQGRHEPHAGHDDASHSILTNGRTVESSRPEGLLRQYGRTERMRPLNCAIR